MKESGPAVVSIFRPGMIIGSRHTPWLLEKVLPAFSFVTPAKYRSITVEQIAKVIDRDVTENATAIGRLPLPRNDGVERMIGEA